MKKNILTVIILALTLINAGLTAFLIFVIVPTSNKTNNLVNKVAQIIDLELEAPKADEEDISISDITTYDLTDKQTYNLKKSDERNHYASMYVTLSINKKHKDTEKYQELLKENENIISEIIRTEFSKYTIDEVNENMKTIKENVKDDIRDHFNSEFIINVSFGNLIMD